MPDRIHVFVSNSDPALHRRVRALSDRVELHTPEELKDRPEAAEHLEVIYGGLARELLPRAKRLRWIQTRGAGVNGLIIPEVRERDIVITNARIHAAAVTEHMFGMLLMLHRRLGEARDQQKTRRWRGKDFTRDLGTLAGKTLGLFGVGVIGGCSARVGKAFGMRTLGLRRTGQPHPDVDRMYSPEDRVEFFRESDVIMNTAPLTEKTRRAIGWEEFSVMKPGAIVVNAGRGGTIDTEALIAALREGRLGAALLDVTDPEPLPDDHPLWSMDRVFITPHYGGAHPGHLEHAAEIFLENLRRYLAGEPMLNVVDKDEGY